MGNALAWPKATWGEQGSYQRLSTFMVRIPPGGFPPFVRRPGPTRFCQARRSVPNARPVEGIRVTGTIKVQEVHCRRRRHRSDLVESIRSFHYGETAAQIIIVVLTVMLPDMLSSRILATLV